MKRLLKEMRATRSGNEKKELLKVVSENAKIQRAFQLAYDPSLLSYINKIPKLEGVGTLNFYDSFCEFENLFREFTTRNLTGNAAKDALKTFLEKCDNETQDIYSNIIKGDLRCGVSISTINKIWPNLIETFDVQLANKYDPEKDYDTNFWYASPKLDGIRCVYVDGKLWSRKGKPIVGFDLIEKDLAEMCEKHDMYYVDGELYSHDIPFQKIQGYVVRNKNIVPEDKAKIKFNIFYASPMDVAKVGRKMFCELQTDVIVARLNNVNWNHYPSLTAVEYSIVTNDPGSIEELCLEYMSQGFEGVMLRDPVISYSFKRDNFLLKHKLFMESDFTIIGFKEGTGKFENMLGALEIEGDTTDGVFIMSEVGSGFSDELRMEFWENRDNLIGKTVEVKYQGFTDDPNDEEYYSLRFPVFLKLKEDR